MSINKVILVGNVGKDPAIRYFDKGVAKVSFPLATSETYTNQQGETITSTEWHNIVLWRALAEVAEKTVKKGSQVYIVGKIKTRSYVDKDGVNKYITEILADTLLLLEKKQGPANSAVHTDTGRNEMHDKGSSGSVINEPSATYQASNENNNKNWPDKGTAGSDDSGMDNLHKNRAGTSQNEDDLPF
jgi:single-strand DNA-binding protein